MFDQNNKTRDSHQKQSDLIMYNHMHNIKHRCLLFGIRFHECEFLSAYRDLGGAPDPPWLTDKDQIWPWLVLH